MEDAIPPTSKAVGFLAYRIMKIKNDFRIGSKKRYAVRKSRYLKVTWDLVDTKNKSIIAKIGLDKKWAGSLRDTLNGKNGPIEKRALLKTLSEIETNP